jgi:Family of unknown function (DUF5677)
MSIDEEGFLSRDIEQVRLNYRKKFPEIIGLVSQFSQMGQAVLPSVAGKSRTLKNLFVSAYFIRGLQQCQAAILLAERGLFTEAYTMVRSGLETVFYLGAATRGVDFARELGRDHVKRTKANAEAHMRRMKELDPNADETHLRSVVDTMLGQGIDPEAMFIEAVAKKAELGMLYDTLYRQLSNGHAHPTVSSLTSIWQMDENQLPLGVLWGPERGDPDEIVDALSLNCVVLHQLIWEWLRFNPDEMLDKRFGEIAARYTKFQAARFCRLEQTPDNA